jgi:hypothetical protein
MEIKIIDDAGIKYALEFDLKKVGAEVAFHEITSTITQSFKRQIEKIIEFIPDANETIIKINLEQARESEAESKNFTALACFDGERSQENKYYFRLYYATIKEIAFSRIGEEASCSVSPDFENTILHELIHAVDLKTIKETQSLRAEDFRLGKKQSDFSTLNSQIDLFKTDIQWAFLNTVVMFRNEGITVLGEKLLGDSPVKPLFSSEKETLGFYQNLLAQLGELSSGTHFSGNIQNNKIYEEIRQQSMLSYHIGDIVLVKLIEKLEPSLAVICIKIASFLLGNSIEKPSVDEAKQLLSYAFQMDMSDYINALVNCQHEEIESTLLLKENLFQLCALIQNENNPTAIQNFTQNIAIAGYNNSKEQFIKLMKESVYTCMTKEELKSGYNEFIQTVSSEDIVESIKQRASYLYPLAIENENEIAQWALTYLFDEEDLIFDKLSVFGWQDDWLILDTAIQLVSKDVI